MKHFDISKFENVPVHYDVTLVFAMRLIIKPFLGLDKFKVIGQTKKIFDIYLKILSYFVLSYSILYYFVPYLILRITYTLIF
jgi:hypothetical protein